MGGWSPSNHGRPTWSRPTPTAAATAAVPDIQDWHSDIQNKQQLLLERMEEYLNDLSEQLERTQNDLQRANPQSTLYKAFSEIVADRRRNPPSADWDGVTVFSEK